MLQNMKQTNYNQGKNNGCYFYRLMVQSISVEVSAVYRWENINNERYGLNFKRNESRL